MGRGVPECDRFRAKYRHRVRDPSKGYPSVTRRWANSPVTVTDDQWLSQADAANELGISYGRTIWRLMNNHLTMAHNSQGHAGVSASSVKAEQSWRRKTPWSRRSLRPFGDMFRWIS